MPRFSRWPHRIFSCLTKSRRIICYHSLSFNSSFPPFSKSRRMHLQNTAPLFCLLPLKFKSPSLTVMSSLTGLPACPQQCILHTAPRISPLKHDVSYIIILNPPLAASEQTLSSAPCSIIWTCPRPPTSNYNEPEKRTPLRAQTVSSSNRYHTPYHTAVFTPCLSSYEIVKNDYYPLGGGGKMGVWGVRG